jgi:toxin ParE1/3/4
MEVVRLSPAALRDLDEIADYIAKDNYARAISFTDELYDACAELSTNPMAHPDRSDLGSGLRLKIYKNYLIIFRIGPKAIRVERIVHGARDMKNLSLK